MIRRGCSCPARAALAAVRFCVSGNYRERGIFGLHGYFCEMAVDSERDLVAVPERLAEFAVLAEPLSVVEKAIQTAMKFRQEPTVTGGVLGAGPLGLLAAMALRARGLDVWLHSLEPADHPRHAWPETGGARYVKVARFQADIVVEATGAFRPPSPNPCQSAARCCAVPGTLAGEGHVSFHDLYWATGSL
jgi:threonine dehydrogenase-like Zn-dependent dehydrogenase